MKKLAAVICLFVTLILTSCSEDEIVEPELPIQSTPIPKHVQASSITFDDMLLLEITPVTAFEVSAHTLRIYPYFDSDEYILMKRIFLSENDFWGTISQPYVTTENFVSASGYSYITLETGVTLGFIPLNDEEAYVVESDVLPSSYVEKVCEQVCKQGT